MTMISYSSSATSFAARNAKSHVASSSSFSSFSFASSRRRSTMMMISNDENEKKNNTNATMTTKKTTKKKNGFRCFASRGGGEVSVCDEEEENASKEVTSSLNNSSVANSTNNNIKRNESEEETQKGVGSVHLILGPMFAGKTTRLLERVKQLEESVSANVLLLKSDKDTRYAKDKVVTHDGRGRECFPVKSLELEVVVKTVGERKWNECDVVAVDEAQFLTNLYEFCRVAADEHNKIVLVAGLNGDFKRETFGEVQETLPLCDSVTKLTAKCKCGRPALFSKRIVNVGDGQELVGGADKYLPACRRCFLN
ncbi:thymidine kinase [Bathycoccus prasinos]|uniref:thymidine kinase n=1 Tax=Bathycoccus prasinos TaxID=41875 RepID=K8F5H9_9CHLO|nr:thymidine kinase [Bathycoccus prasinos]CCO20075.1 thymidine kinase [Bathycoccus prasinos]|eukprot:XP_007508989.1 thymidine kinase [Bathycoccus prasinos]